MMNIDYDELWAEFRKNYLCIDCKRKSMKSGLWDTYCQPCHEAFMMKCVRKKTEAVK